ncbi:MAG: hypothetical protein RL491_472 [Bacteroidota bacterium]
MSTITKNSTLIQNGVSTPVVDVVAVEESLHISINGKPFTVTMRTPGNEEALVRGLLYTEEVYRDVEPLVLEQIERNAKGLITSVDVRIPAQKILKDFASSRNLVSASSCGLCGRTSFEDTVTNNVVDDMVAIDASIIPSLFQKMRAAQQDFSSSGGTHAAAAFDAVGNMLGVMEDIGRHNAVDKLIGHLLMENHLSQAKCIIVSGRLSFEIVNKVLSAGIPVLASVSAPSSMAIEMADKGGITLLGFCREQKMTIYAHPERMSINHATPVTN